MNLTRRNFLIALTAVAAAPLAAAITRRSRPEEPLIILDESCNLPFHELSFPYRSRIILPYRDDDVVTITWHPYRLAPSNHVTI